MEINELKNWKLKEVPGNVEIVEIGATDFINKKLYELKIQGLHHEHFHRGETFIDWANRPEHYKFFFDKEGLEEQIKDWFEKSKLVQAEFIIITYLQEEVVVKVPTEIFLADWEGFIRSTLYNGLFFSEDYVLIMEVSRDYCLHSNFKIMSRS